MLLDSGAGCVNTGSLVNNGGGEGVFGVSSRLRLRRLRCALVGIGV